MKKLLVVLFILLVPGLSSGGEEINIKDVTPPAAHRDSDQPDVFFYLAHTCEVFAQDCHPDNLVSNPFAAYIKVFVPSTQPYTRHYIVTDIEGAMVGYFSNTDTLDLGIWHLSRSFSLTPGKLYRFIAIVSGMNGATAVSNPYTFKVVF